LKRVLLDENLPHRLRPLLAEFDVWTVTRAGWAGVKNGALLKLAEESFDVFVTADLNIPHQQNLRGSMLGFVLLRAGGTQFKDVRPFIEELKEAIASVLAGQLLYVPADSPRG
jgi:predicted nuclease of predicted toxin-antitoxin system